MRFPWRRKTYRECTDAIGAAYGRYLDGEISHPELQKVIDANRYDYMWLFRQMAKREQKREKR